jgi:Tfp pilus assembly protein PilN
MNEDNVPKPLLNLPRRSQKKLRLDGRSRFILVLALFNTMFCLLVLLSLWNVQLAEDKRQMESYIQILVTRQKNLEGEIETLKRAAKPLLLVCHLRPDPKTQLYRQLIL